MRLRSEHKDFAHLLTAQQLQEATEAAAATPAEDCPFCGAAPEVDIAIMYHQFPAVAIRCPQCKVQTHFLAAGTMITGSVYTLTDRIRQSATIWNRRKA